MKPDANRLVDLMRTRYIDTVDLPDLMKRSDVATHIAVASMQALAVLLEDEPLVALLAARPKLRADLAQEIRQAAAQLRK